jgi:small subunit ribosomal protein S5
MLKPATPGTGVIAGSGVRAVLEVAGVQNVLTKCLGSRNPHNLVKATVQGLQQLRRPGEIARMRGMTVTELFGTRSAE